METGANRGGPLSATLTALVLGEVLRPLDAVMKARARKRFPMARVDASDHAAGGETHPMGYIDDGGGVILHVNVLFFFKEFNRLGQPLGLHLNPSQTRILISISGTSSLTNIEREYGSKIASDL